MKHEQTAKKVCAVVPKIIIGGDKERYHEIATDALK